MRQSGQIVLRQFFQFSIIFLVEVGRRGFLSDEVVEMARTVQVAF
jgi:hypothetical protein